jgi:hypothetical protein
MLAHAFIDITSAKPLLLSGSAVRYSQMPRLPIHATLCRAVKLQQAVL